MGGYLHNPDYWLHTDGADRTCKECAGKHAVHVAEAYLPERIKSGEWTPAALASPGEGAATPAVVIEDEVDPEGVAKWKPARHSARRPIPS